MSFSTTGTCPHDRGVFIFPGDGPWLGDPADPDHGGYPWVHDTTMTPGHLEVCELMRFATPEEAGELCACGHPSHEHLWNPGPIGHEYKPVPCPCGCPDFRHRPQDIMKWRAAEAGRWSWSPAPVAAVAPVELAEDEPAADQLELFPSPARLPRGEAKRRKDPRRRTATVTVAGGAL